MILNANYSFYNYIGRSACSRLGDVLAVEDLSYNEVTDLLVNKQGMTERMKAIYGFVGGRIKLIKKVTRKLEKGDSWKSITSISR